MKNMTVLSENFRFLVVKVSVYLNRHGFVMVPNVANSKIQGAVVPEKSLTLVSLCITFK